MYPRNGEEFCSRLHAETSAPRAPLASNDPLSDTLSGTLLAFDTGKALKVVNEMSVDTRSGNALRYLR